MLTTCLLDLPFTRALNHNVSFFSSIFLTSLEIYVWLSCLPIRSCLKAEAEAHGAVLAANSTVTGGKVSAEGITVEVTDSADLRNADGAPVPPTMRLNCSTVVNAAGLDAQAIAKVKETFSFQLQTFDCGLRVEAAWQPTQSLPT